MYFLKIAICTYLIYKLTEVGQIVLAALVAAAILWDAIAEQRAKSPRS